MRLTRVDFRGYKRLLDTGCNVDADLIAIVGPNEAGKTSVLEALSWLTRGGPIDRRKINRTVDTDFAAPIVTAKFVLDEHERGLFADAGTDVEPSSVTYLRYQNGEAEIRFHPPLIRSPGSREAALSALAEAHLERRLAGQEEATALAQILEVARSRAEWDQKIGRAARSLIEWLEMPVTESAPGNDGSPVEKPAPSHDLSAARSLSVWVQQMAEPAPATVASEVVVDRIPQFLLFSRADRALGFEYNLAYRSVTQGGVSKRVPSEDVQNPDAGLSNLLALSGSSIRELADLVQSGVPERTSSRIRALNRKLNEAFTPLWSQRQLQVRLEISATTLRVFIDEGEDTARFTDRSDGLRVFVALIAFLARHASDPAPILLIDEADTHLHYDAQADLINFLLELPSRTIYTTHSPGCLPLDLGVGVRVIRPDTEKAASALSNNFWEDGQPGFTPLLFAMGAGAAAFSALRAAVFTEGASDMMLLPTLFRCATRERTLGYQIVPGLANIHPSDLGSAEYAAIRVAYLLDGDQGGDKHQEALIQSGVPRERIIRLPSGLATEDLIEPQLYVDAVNHVLADSGRPERVALPQLRPALKKGASIAKATEDVLGGHRNAPSKVAVAGRLLALGGTLVLTDLARQHLAECHTQLKLLLRT